MPAFFTPEDADFYSRLTAVKRDDVQGRSRSRVSVCVGRSLLTSYRNISSAPAGRYVTLPIATASATAAAAAAAAAQFTRLLTMTLTVRRQQSRRRQASTLTSLTQLVGLTSRNQRHVLSMCSFTCYTHTCIQLMAYISWSKCCLSVSVCVCIWTRMAQIVTAVHVDL